MVRMKLKKLIFKFSYVQLFHYSSVELIYVLEKHDIPLIVGSVL